MELNRTTKIVCTIIGIMAFLMFFAWASNEDYKEAVISSMSNSAYNKIRSELGNDCTTQEIIDQYKSNKLFYDSLQ